VITATGASVPQLERCRDAQLCDEQPTCKKLEQMARAVGQAQMSVHPTALLGVLLMTSWQDGSVPAPVKVRASRRRSTSSLVRSGMARFLLKLASLVEDDSHPGMHELALMLPEVVGAQAQFAVPGIRNEHAQQHIGLGTAPIAAISRRKSDRSHVTPPCGWPFLICGAEVIDTGVHQFIEEAQLRDLTRLAPLHSRSAHCHGIIRVLTGHQNVSDSAVGNDSSAACAHPA
jgi:hypothetical protein